MEERIMELERRVEELERSQIEVLKLLGMASESINKLQLADMKILDTFKLLTK